jgi:hypothetical protein
MAGAASFDDAVKQACEMSLRGDVSGISRISETKRTPLTGIHQRLLQNTDLCQKLLDRLASRNPVSECNAEHALRALLLVPPSYETPWRAVLQLLDSLHSQSGWLGTSHNALFAGIADAQTFLQQTISSLWRDGSQKRMKASEITSASDSPRAILVDIARRAVKPLHDVCAAAIHTNSDNRHWVAPLDLVVTVVSLCRELEGRDSPTNAIILELILSNPVLPERILPLLTMINDLQPHLRKLDLDRLQELLRRALIQKLVPTLDLPGFARFIIGFSSLSEDWKQLLLHLLEAASSDMGSYATVEAVIQNSFTSVSMHGLYQWYCVDTPESIPKWIIANYYLLLFEAVRQSGSQIVSCLLSRSLGKKNKTYDIQDLCCQSMTRLLFPFAHKLHRCGVKSLQHLLDGVRYVGRGEFQRADKSLYDMELYLLTQSLYLGSGQLEIGSQRLYATERAQAWVHVASLLLSKRCIASKMTAILVFVTVFCEVPASRATLVRYLSEQGRPFELLDSIIVSMLVRSLSNDVDLECLEPINRVLSSKVLSIDAFQELSDALSGVNWGRGAILAVCHKRLQAYFAPWWDSIENRGSGDRREALQTSLYGLCTLLGEWDEVGWQAWVLLSDFIVIDKPALSIVIRRWLYGQLKQLVLQEKFPLSTVEHLLRALLTRLLSYFEWIDEKFQFFPGRALASFGPDRGLLVKDDVNSLFEVTVELTLHVSLRRCTNLRELERYREVFQRICTNLTSESVISISSLVGLDDEKTLEYRVVLALLTSAMAYVSGTQSETKVSSYSVTTTASSGLLFDVSEKLAADERELFLAGPLCSMRDASCWLLGNACTTTSGGATLEPKRSEYTSVCDLVVRVLCISVQAVDEEEMLCLAMCVSDVYVIRGASIFHEEGLMFHSNVQSMSSISTIALLSGVLPSLFVEDETKIEDLDRVVHTITNVCEEISHSFETTTEKPPISNTTGLLGAFSNLYKQVCNEQPAVQLIQYLDNLSKCQRGLLGINSADEIDIYVRSFRTSVVQALFNCMGAVLRYHLSDLKASHVITIDGSDAATFMTETMKIMSESLLQGLDGLSGGVSEVMYGILIDIIDSACTMTEELGPSVLEPALVLETAESVINTISEILFTFPITVPSLFKATIDLVLVRLSSLRRETLRWSSNTSAKCDCRFRQVFDELSRQALGGLEMVACDANVWMKPVQQKEDMDSVQEKNENELDRDNGEPERRKADGIPLHISVPVALSPSISNRKQPRIELCSESTWIHALGGLLFSVDHCFLEAQAALSSHEREETVDSIIDGFQTNLNQVEDLSLSLSFVVKLLKRFEKGTAKYQCEVLILAMILPDTLKSKFVVLMDQVSSILVKSTRLLVQASQKGRAPPRAFREALLFFSIWLSIPDQDFVKAARQWFHAERVRIKNDASFQRERNKALSKLPKVMFRIDEFEIALQKFSDSIVAGMKKDSSRLHWCQLMDQIITSIVKASRGTSRGYKFSLSKSLSHQLKLASDSRTEAYQQSLRLLGANKKRKDFDKTVAQRIQRERKRPVPRSRNQVVDQWLYLDREDHDDEIDDDAYNDLEDFLVDG